MSSSPTRMRRPSSNSHPTFEPKAVRYRSVSIFQGWIHPVFQRLACTETAHIGEHVIQRPRVLTWMRRSFAAAFAALPADAQARCRRMRVRRRLNEGDPGWLAPIVRTNPRSGLESLHSPIWASRPGVRPPVTIDGETEGASRQLLDELEAHLLQPEFRYDHAHAPGDVTIWDNYMTLHNSPPMKVGIRSSDDARLMYRLSCKGEPALTLPRQDGAAWLDAHIAAGYRSGVV